MFVYARTPAALWPFSFVLMGDVTGRWHSSRFDTTRLSPGVVVVVALRAIHRRIGGESGVGGAQREMCVVFEWELGGGGWYKDPPSSPQDE